MRALCATLGEPESAFESLHVVGTNGKSSVALMTAALLARAGLRTGACVSPHLHRWSERIRIGGEEIPAAGFADAVATVAAAVPEVEAELPAGERVTQFEAAIAATFVAFREGGVEAAVVEAGLGGRLDATNVIASRATALTSVALDHTEWLGETLAEIAAEKLAVLEPGSTLVVGELAAGIDAQARAAARERGAAFVRAAEPEPELLPERFAPYLRRNAGVAVELARVLAPALDGERIAAALQGVALAGRAELLDREPPLILDAAHNEQGARALAEALPGLSSGKPVVGCVSLLAEKDAAAFAGALAPALAAVVCTAADPGPAMGRPGAAALDPERLAAAFRAGGCEAKVVSEPGAAVRRALAHAGEGGGVALCAGSHYLLRHAWTVRPAQSCSR